jgi:phosphatidylglycerophosphatase A
MSIDIHALMACLAIGLGIGHIPLLPGTAGALVGAVLALGLKNMRLPMRLIVTATLVALAIPICEYGEQVHAVKDDPRIVADELLTFPVATLALSSQHHPALFAGVFVTSRVLDGLKPPPARAAERLRGGVGIVLDDVVANVWTLALSLIAQRWWQRRHDT